MSKTVILKDKNGDKIYPYSYANIIKINNGSTVQQELENISSAGYITNEQLSNCGYITQYTENDPTVPIFVKNITQEDITNWSSYANVNANWNSTSGYAQILNKPDILEIVELYNNDTTGVLATSNYAISFQEDMSTFDFLRCYFRASAHNSSDNNAIPSGVLIIDLNPESALSSGEFTGSISIPYVNNDNRYAAYRCMVSANKTQFRVIAQQSLYGTAATNISNAEHGIYCYKIEGVRTGGVAAANGEGGGSSFIELDPVFGASPAAGITSSDITNWNSKTDNVGTITGITMNSASKGTSGVVDLGTVLTEHQSLSSYVTSGYYDTTTRKIYLRHGTNVLSEIDANDFIKDGMVDTAYVQGSYLVISFNTDAGKHPVEVPITDIFNPINYYTKTEIDNAGYLTAHQDLSSYVSKTELNAAGYLTSFTETDPIYSASAAAGITSADITNWNSYANVQSDWSETDSTSNSYILNKPIIPNGLPEVNSTYNGKILQVVDGAWTLVTPLNLYSGTGTPNNSQGNNGDLYMQI